MAFFKFPWPGQRQPQRVEKSAKPPPPAPAESIEVMRRRARHRLIGAAVLVLAGVIGFPLLFDTQPRPIAVDIPIEIPDRNKAAPLALPVPSAQAPATQPQAAKSANATASASATASTTASDLADGQERTPDARPAASRPAQATATAPAAAPRPTPEPKSARTDDAARALALLEGRSPTPAAATAAEASFIVQVGAFADAGKAREVRAKVERAGIKTYVQVLETKDGKRTRVRVGPYASRTEADKAAARIRALNLSASILTL